MPGDPATRLREKRPGALPPHQRHSIATTTSTGRTVVDANELFKQPDVQEFLDLLEEHRDAILEPDNNGPR